MWSRDRTVCVVFNGEIYNHNELRHRLADRGHLLEGRSDTAVIAPLYLEYGPAFVERLQGMFSIALFDLRRQRLVLARDRFGIKPLFWGKTPHGLAFASEIPPLRKIRGIDLDVDPQAIFDYTALHHIPPPQTMHRGIRSVEPGTLLVAEVGPTGIETNIRRYHSWRHGGNGPRDPTEALHQTEERLDYAVSSQLESDVPLGAMLSGGIDSGLISHAAQQQLGGGLRTFGVSFDEERYDERAAFESAAAAIESLHLTLTPGVGNSWDDVAPVLLACGQPFADSSILAVDTLCRAVRQHVTVALSGDGGDEAFAGYDHFGRIYALAPVLRVPAAIRRPILSTAARVLDRSAARTDRIPPQLSNRLRDLTRTKTIPEVVADQMAWVRRSEQLALWSGPSVEPTARLFEPTWPGSRSRSTLDSLFDTLTEADVRVRLAGDYLPKVDTASMRHSLEVRVPMLDERLFQFGLDLPRDLRRPRRGPGKRVLRQVAERRLPVIAGLPKRGFTVPFDNWVDDEFRTSVDDLRTSGGRIDDWIDPHWSQQILRHFSRRTLPERTNRSGLYQRALMLISLELHLQSVEA